MSKARWFVVYRATCAGYVYIGRKHCKPGHRPTASSLGIDAGYSQLYKGSGKIWKLVRAKYPHEPRTYEILSKHRNEARQLAAERKAIAEARREYGDRCTNITDGGKDGFTTAIIARIKDEHSDELSSWSRLGAAAMHAKYTPEQKREWSRAGGCKPSAAKGRPVLVRHIAPKPPRSRGSKKHRAVEALVRASGATRVELDRIGNGRQLVDTLRRHGYCIEQIAPATWRIRDDCPSHLVQ